MNIIPVIRDLLLRNQIAIVPGFGAFVFSQKPAQLNKVTGVLTPPTVTVKFDRTRQSDDLQLITHLSRKTGLDKDRAIAAVNEFRNAVEEKLNSGEPVNLEGFGTLSKKVSGEVIFSGDVELLKRISLFEMPSIEVPRARTLTAETPQTPERKEVPVTEKIVVQARKEPEHHNRRRWIIPVVLLGLLVGMLVVIHLTGNMGMLMSDIKSVFVSEPKDSTRQLVFGNEAGDSINIPDTLTSQISRELDRQVDRSRALSIEEQESKPVDNRILPAPAQPGNTEVSYARLYHVVAGSFTVLANAQKQRSALQAKGLEAEILPKKGNFYMVSLGSYDTSAEADTERNRLQKAAGLELWVMKNK